MAALEIGIIADDLSGGAECAVRALLRVSRSSILLNVAAAAGTRDGDAGDALDPSRVLTVDTHSRGLEPLAAASKAAAAAAVLATAPVVVKKVDSLLRGNVAAEIAAVAEQLGRTPVVAVSNPALGRIVRDGVLHVRGIPLHETDLWRVETVDAPLSVHAALSPLPTVLVPQRTIDAGVAAVARALRDIAAAGAVAVCDAETETDLETIHAATTATSTHALLVGSGAMADIAVRAIAPDHSVGADHSATTAHDSATLRLPHLRLPHLGSLLMVLGTRASAAAQQLAQLAGAATHVELVDPAVLLIDPRGLQTRLAEIAAEGLVVVALDPASGAQSGDVSRLVATLADAVTPQVRRFDGVFLTGGETARAILDRLGVTSLTVIAELERGTVVSTTADGLVVVTRPGSFGGADSLVSTSRRLLGSDPAGGSALTTPPTEPTEPTEHGEPTEPTTAAAGGIEPARTPTHPIEAATAATSAPTKENP